MDRYPHPPTVIGATALCLVSLIKTFGPKDTVLPAFTPPVVEIEIDEGFLLEDDAVSNNGTVSTVEYLSNAPSASTLILVAMSALILLFLGFCVRRVWQTMSMRTRLPRPRNAVLTFLLVTVVLLALLFSTLWALSFRENRMCCQDACDSTLPFIPIVLLLAVWIVRKLWIQTPHVRIWITMLSTLLACMIFLNLWTKAHHWGPCELIGYIVPALVLLASMAVRKLSVQAHQRRFWNITLCVALAGLLLLALWVAKNAPNQFICCSAPNLTIYFVPTLLLLASWAAKHLQTLPPRRFHKITLYVTLAFLLILAVWAMKAALREACCCDCDFQEYLLPFFLVASLWALKKLCIWAPRRRISHIIRIWTLLFVLLLVLWLLLKLQTQTLSCCIWNQALYLTLMFLSLFAPWPTPEVRIPTHHRHLPGLEARMMLPPVQIIIIAFQHTIFGVQTLVLNPLRRVMSFVVIILTFPVLLITLPVNHLSYFMRPIEPAKEERAASPTIAPTEDQADPGCQSEIKRLRTIIRFLVALFRVSKLRSSAKIARLQNATARASEHAAQEITRLTRRYDELVESTREALDPTGIYGHGQSLVYIIHRVRDRITRQMAEVKRKEEALQGSSAMKAVEEARKSAEASTASLKDQLQTQETAHEVEMTRVQSALNAKVAEVEEISKAKTDAAIACQAEKDQLAKTLDDMKAAQNSHADSMSDIKGQLTSAESKLQEAVTRSQRLNTGMEEMKTAQRSHANDMGHMKTQLADANSKLQEALAKVQEMETAMNERSSQMESTSSTLATIKEQSESLKRSKSEQESAEAKTRSLELDISKLNQEVEGLHLHLSNATSAAADKDDQIRTLKEQVAAFTAQDARQPPHAAGETSIDSNTETSPNAAVQISALNGALDEERARAQSLASQVQYLQHLQQQQQEYFQHSEARTQGLNQELGVANSKVAELTQKLNSGSLQYDDLGATLRSAEQKLSHLENYRRDADAELRRQEQNIEASQGETHRAREMCDAQRQELNVLRSNVKTLESELQNKQLAVTSSFQFGTAVEAREPFVFGSTAPSMRPLPEDSSQAPNSEVNKSTKPAEAQPSTFKMPSGFQLDPNHDFGFSFERPAAITQEPLPEQRLFNLPPADAETASHPPQRFDSEDPAEVAEEERTQEVLRRLVEIDAQDEDAETDAHSASTAFPDQDAETNAQPCPTTFSDDDDFFTSLQQRLDDNNDPSLNVDVDWSNEDLNNLDVNEYDFSDLPDTGSGYGNHVPDDWNPNSGREDYDILSDYDQPGRPEPQPEAEAEWPPLNLNADEEAEICARVDAFAQYDPADWNPTDQQPEGQLDSAQAGPSSSHSYPPQSRKRSRLED